MNPVRIYIVRHGETEENRQGIVQGHLDTSLNSEGERQSDLVAKALKDVPFDTCYSSDLQRAVETAKRVLVHHSGVELQTQLGVRERVSRGPGSNCAFYFLSDGLNSTWAFFKDTCGGEVRDSSRRTAKEGRWMSQKVRRRSRHVR